MPKQTSIEWLVTELNQMIDYIPLSKWDKIADIIEKAKQMHKEEMINLLQWMNKVAEKNPMQLETDHDDIVEQYYNETYGGNNES